MFPISDRIDTLRAFIAVCDAGSFSAAGSQLAITASAASRHVASLERRLGVQFFHRSTRSLRLTRAGELYLPRARLIVEQLEAADAVALHEGGAPAGTLRISAPPIFGRLYLSPVLAMYMNGYPDVRIDVSLDNELARMIEDGFDVAVRVGDLRDSTLLVRNLGRTRPVRVASPTYLSAHPAPAKPRDLRHHRLIAHKGLSQRRSWRFRINDEVRSVAIEPSFHSDSSEASIAFAVEGGGIAAALDYQVRSYLRDGQLVEVLQEFAPPSVPIQAVMPAARFISPSVRALLDVLVEERHRWGG